MAAGDILTLSIDGQLVSTGNDILDTLSRLLLVVTQTGDGAFHQNYIASTADTVLALPASVVPGVLFVWNRGATNNLIVGPTAAGAIVALANIKPGHWALMPIDAGVTVRYQAAAGTTPFVARAWGY